MQTDFWSKDYLLNPDFEELYNFVDEASGKVLLFSPRSEIDFGDDLFYQLCRNGDFTTEEYTHCESNLNAVFVELAHINELVAFAAVRDIGQSKETEELTGLNKSQLRSIKSFFCRRQDISSKEEIKQLLYCITRGIGPVYALAVDWNILLLMQDIHGCIIPSKSTDEAALRQMLQIFEKNDFIVSQIDNTNRK